MSNSTSLIDDCNIQILTNMSCNLACKYCYEKDKNGKINTPKSIIKFVKFMIDENPNKKTYILDFLGGESFMVPELLDKVCTFAYNYVSSKQKNQNLIINISSNGTLINEEKVRNFILKFKRHINIGLSIDGNKEKHNKNRIYHDGRGSYDDVIANLKWLREVLPSEMIGVKATYRVDEIETLGDDVINLFNLGFPKVGANIVYEDNIDFDAGLIVARELIKVADYIIDNNLENTHEYFQLTTQDIDHIRHYNSALKRNLESSNRVEPDKNYCGSCKYMRCLGFDNLIYGCARFCTMNKPNMEIGHLEDDRIVITNQKLIDEVINQYKHTEQDCLDCSIRESCPRCSAVPYETGISLDAKDASKGHCGWTHAAAVARFYMCLKLYRKEHPEVQ